MTQLDKIEQKLDALTNIVQSLLDAVISEDEDDDEVMDLSGTATRARDESQPL